MCGLCGLNNSDPVHKANFPVNTIIFGALKVIGKVGKVETNFVSVKFAYFTVTSSVKPTRVLSVSLVKKTF